MAEITTPAAGELRLKSGTGEHASFDEIYGSADLKPAKLGYTILKICDMAQSDYIRDLPVESRRGAVLMALDAAGVPVEDVLRDAADRQGALSAYEKSQQEAIQELESRMARDNRKLREELERVTAQLEARMQANNAEVNREKDSLRAWQDRKQRELQRIGAAVDLCSPKNNAQSTGVLTMPIERAVAN